MLWQVPLFFVFAALVVGIVRELIAVARDPDQSLKGYVAAAFLGGALAVSGAITEDWDWVGDGLSFMDLAATLVSFMMYPALTIGAYAVYHRMRRSE